MSDADRGLVWRPSAIGAALRDMPLRSAAATLVLVARQLEAEREELQTPTRPRERIGGTERYIADLEAAIDYLEEQHPTLRAYGMRERGSWGA